MLGQPASSQTVWRSSSLTSCLSAVNSGPVRSLVLIQLGLRSIGVCALRTSRRSIGRPSGATALTLAPQSRRALVGLDVPVGAGTLSLRGVSGGLGRPTDPP